MLDLGLECVESLLDGSSSTRGGSVSHDFAGQLVSMYRNASKHRRLITLNVRAPVPYILSVLLHRQGRKVCGRPIVVVHVARLDNNGRERALILRLEGQIQECAPRSSHRSLEMVEMDR